ncbi:hypothetical protein QJS10_CPA08g00391 [Acorus calamus]|uniref:Uncharacterized protein n=1 Tax=Acorus calamus TaxID=4465 RepID=A0AAV9ECZ4_ACOCL|nr:hypothetical protein QJS10_CPA08g00391 [Acorus calamus]
MTDRCSLSAHSASRFGITATSEGTPPTNALNSEDSLVGSDRTRTDRRRHRPSSPGIRPVRTFPSSFTVSRFAHPPISGGIRPVKKLQESLRWTREQQTRPIRIGPERRLQRSTDSSEGAAPIRRSGIHPEKELRERSSDRRWGDRRRR